MHLSPATFECASHLPVRSISSSRDLEWTSLLIDHQEVVASDDIFETWPTPDQTVVVMLRGAQEIESHRRGQWRRTVYRAGTVGMTTGGVTERLRRRLGRDAGVATKVNIYVPHALITETKQFLHKTGHLPMSNATTTSGFEDRAVREMALALLHAMRSGASNLYADSAVRWLAIHLLAGSRWGDRLSAEDDLPALRDRRLRRVIDYIESHLAEALTVETLAAEAAVSKFHFTRMFQRATGCTPHRWLSERRMQNARRMLEQGSDSIGEVARRCGFARPNHFSTQFAKRFGTTPSGYRSRL